MTCNHVLNDMLFRCDRCGMDKDGIVNEARENRMDAYFRYGVPVSAWVGGAWTGFARRERA